MVEYILIFEILPFYCEQVKHKDFVWEFEDFAAKTRLSKNILSFENQNINYEHFIKYDFKYKIVRNSSWCEVKHYCFDRTKII